MSQPPPYPSYPSYPQGADPSRPGVLAPPEPPPAVRHLATLMLVRAAVGILGLIVSLSRIGALRTRIENQRTLSPSAVDAVVTTSVAVGVVLGVGFTVLYVLLSRKVLQRRNWARIVTLVLEVLGVLSLLGAAVQNQLAASRVIIVTAGLSDLGILLLVVSRASREFFRGGRLG